jgi:hypothetical protein
MPQIRKRIDAIVSNITSTQLIIGLIFVAVSYYVTKDTLPLFCLLVFFVVYMMRPGILESTPQSRTTIRENNQIKRKVIYLNSELEGQLHRLRKYKRYNRKEYTEGKNYIKMFQSHLLDLAREDMAHPKQVFENAQLYLTLAMNHFHAISFSIPENNYNSTLKYNKTISHKLVKGLSDTCKALYSHGYALLVSLSERFNADFHRNPDIYKSKMILTPDNIRASNEVSGSDMF